MVILRACSHSLHRMRGVVMLVALSMLMSMGMTQGVVLAANADLLPDQSLCVEWLPGCEGGDVPYDFRDNILFTDLTGGVVNFALFMLAGVSVAVIVVAGFMLLMGGYNDEFYSRAIKAIIYACVGLLVAAFSFYIVDFLSRLPFPGF